MPLPNVRIVLVQPTHAGNVGSVARAMKNMGLESLYLVSPDTDPTAPEARARAVGADDVLAGARHQAAQQGCVNARRADAAVAPEADPARTCPREMSTDRAA